MTLRDYRPSDFRRLCQIDRQCFEPGVAYSAADLRSIVHAAGAVTIVAENSRGQIVAFAVAQNEGRSRGRIVTLDVLAGYRGRGVGRRLMLHCEQRLREAGVRAARLETAVGNRKAQALYHSLGYTCIKRLGRYYATGEDAWVMEKRLV